MYLSKLSLIWRAVWQISTDIDWIITIITIIVKARALGTEAGAESAKNPHGKQLVGLLKVESSNLRVGSKRLRKTNECTERKVFGIR